MNVVRHSLTGLLKIVHGIYGLPPQARPMKRWVAPTLRELERRRKKAGPQPPQRRSTYLEWNYDAEIFAFAKRLREEFKEDLLRRAFIHRSYVIQQEMKENETESPSMQDNQELIKEGEAFIYDCIKQNYKQQYPAEIVDAITAHLTTEAMLSHVASHMGVADLILSADFPVEKATLASSFKAIVAALKQSAGEQRAETFVRDFLMCHVKGKNVDEIWEPKNPYEYLLRLAGEKGYTEVEPRLCNQSAANTILANYQVGLYSDKKLLGIGWGESVEIAKDTAALDAIYKLQGVK